MVRDTSIEAYNHIKQSGQMNKMEQKVYDFLSIHPRGLTNMEISLRLKMPINAVTGRMNGLVKKGFVKINGKRQNPVSGRLNHVWQVQGLEEQLNLI